MSQMTAFPRFLIGFALCSTLQIGQAQTSAFDVFEYRVEGATLLPRADVERAVYPFLGEQKTVQDVEAARAALEKLYHDHGFLTVLVELPEQRVASRVVQLNVVEAPVGKLRITGSRYYALGVIREGVPSLAEGTVPNFQNAQQDLAQLNRNTDRRVTPVLKPSETPGKVDIELKVQDEFPLHASLEVNNKYSANTSQTRAVAQLRYDNLFQRDHSVSLQYQVAPERPSDAKVVSLSYVIPTKSDLTWALYSVHSTSNVAVVGDLHVIGNGSINGVRLIQALPAASTQPDLTHSLTYGFDIKDFKQSILLGSDSIASPVRYTPLSTQYSATWRAPNEADASSTTLDLGLNVLLRGMGGNRDQFANKGAGASPSFYIWRGDLQRTQVLPAKWSILAKTDFQWAHEPLISNEGYSAGGADSVRGYTESERLGDDGVRASLELHTPSLWGDADRHEVGAGSAGSAYVLGFVEGAHLVVRQPQAGQQTHFELASLGLGLRFNARGLGLELDGAHALKSGSTTKAGDNRLLFKVSYGL